MTDNDRERLAAELKRAMTQALAGSLSDAVPTTKQSGRGRGSSTQVRYGPTGPVAPGIRWRAISFTPALLDAVLAGRKTQTRRPVRPAPGTVVDAVARTASGEIIASLFNRGDRLWVREKWARDERDAETFRYERDHVAPEGSEKRRWLPPRFMPRVAARTFLQVTAVSVERLTQIDAGSALAEGIEPSRDPVASFMAQWDAIYGASEFAARNDPWVWVIHFTRD